VTARRRGPWRAAVALAGALAALVASAVPASADRAARQAAPATTEVVPAPAPAPAPPPAPAAVAAPKVLLLGDSVLDQLGAPAAGTLRRLGAEVVVDGVWGSSLLTRDQYDMGQPIPDGVGGSWFRRADAEVAAFRPTIVGVSLNHNYFEPYPRDAAGRPISDQSSAAFATMVRQQLRLFVEHLSRFGATVVLIAPPPHDPAVPLPVWDVYEQVATADGIPIVDGGTAFGGGGARYSEVRRDCVGALRSIHFDGVHLTPWASSVMGTAVGRDLAELAGLTVAPDAPAADPCASAADGWANMPGSFKTAAGA
jgi:hypothetical protein